MNKQRFSKKVTTLGAAIALAALLGVTAANGPTVYLDPGTGHGVAIRTGKRQDAQLQQVVLCGAPAASSVSDGAPVVSGNLWELSATRDLGKGWTATHAGFELEDVVAAYTAWFCSAGVQMSAATGSSQVQQFTVIGASLGADVRVVFADIGTGVSVYIGRF